MGRYAGKQARNEKRWGKREHQLRSAEGGQVLGIVGTIVALFILGAVHLAFALVWALGEMVRVLVNARR